MKNIQCLGLIVVTMGALTIGGITASAQTTGSDNLPSQVGQLVVTDTAKFAKIKDNYKSFDLMTTAPNSVDGTRTTSWESANLSDQPFNNVVRVQKVANNGSRYGWYQISRLGSLSNARYWVSGQAVTKPTTFLAALTAKNTTSTTSIDHPALTSEIQFTIKKAVPVYNVKGLDLLMLTTPNETTSYHLTQDQVVKTPAGQILYPIGHDRYVNSHDVNASHVTLL